MDASLIQAQIAEDAKKRQMERWKILQDTQTKIFETHSQISLDFFKSSNKMADAWSQAAGN